MQIVFTYPVSPQYAGKIGEPVTVSREEGEKWVRSGVAHHYIPPTPKPKPAAAPKAVEAAKADEDASAAAEPEPAVKMPRRAPAVKKAADGE